MEEVKSNPIEEIKEDLIADKLSALNSKPIPEYTPTQESFAVLKESTLSLTQSDKQSFQLVHTPQQEEVNLLEKESESDSDKPFYKPQPQIYFSES